MCVMCINDINNNDIINNSNNVKILMVILLKCV